MRELIEKNAPLLQSRDGMLHSFSQTKAELSLSQTQFRVATPRVKPGSGLKL
jgi:hypothetical protein